MKPTRREASIFSVSAIDLFASALGAFIVVALVLLPYFPNTGDAPAQPPVDPTVRSVAASRHLARRSSRRLRAQATRAGGRPGRGGTPSRAASCRRRSERGASERASAPPAPDAREPHFARRGGRRSRSRIAQFGSGARRRRAPASANSRGRSTPRCRRSGRCRRWISSSPSTRPASMTGEVASLREEIAGLSALLADLTDDAAVGIIDFKDGCGGAVGVAHRPAPAHRPGVRAPAGRLHPLDAPRLAALQHDVRRGLRRGATRGRQRRLAPRQRAPVDRLDLRQPGPRPPPGAGRGRRPTLLAWPRRPAHRLGRARRHERLCPDLPRYRGVHAARRSRRAAGSSSAPTRTRRCR